MDAYLDYHRLNPYLGLLSPLLHEMLLLALGKEVAAACHYDAKLRPSSEQWWWW